MSTMMNTTPTQLCKIIEAAIMVAGKPVTIAHLQKLFDETEQPSTQDIREALQVITENYQESGIELREVASGFQFQAKVELSPWLTRLWDERPPRYSRAILETLSLIAYRQPITRAEIEDIRGVVVSSHITKTLLEREWIKIVGYREVPGKPALYATTKAFLDHFNLKSLTELPTLADIKDLDSQETKLQIQLQLPTGDEAEDEIEAEPTLTMDIIGIEAESNLAIDTIETESNMAAIDEIEIAMDTIEELTHSDIPSETPIDIDVDESQLEPVDA